MNWNHFYWVPGKQPNPFGLAEKIIVNNLRKNRPFSSEKLPVNLSTYGRVDT